MKTSRMRDINHLPRVPRYHISNFNGLLSGTFCTAVTRTPIGRFILAPIHRPFASRINDGM